MNIVKTGTHKLFALVSAVMIAFTAAFGALNFRSSAEEVSYIATWDEYKVVNNLTTKTWNLVANAIDDCIEKLKKAIKDGLSEDNEKDAENDIQKTHDKFIKKIDDLLAAKEKEIMTV